MKALRLIIVSGSMLVLTACSTMSAPTIGAKPADTPPRLVNSSSKQGVEWNSIAAFGPVPANMQKEGDAVCSQDTFILKSKAIGYHPNALDKAGQPIQGGGYVCSN
ncbi:hypothetical protein [uncultured Thiothrix sp.]|uniref:hypothetical protein n=1 Tax=uncultured Thiothrix sp. TaxID=223185 RepID=UPI00262B0987|nr:hypothetical protein [uncultured Thiothrix sp.]